MPAKSPSRREVESKLRFEKGVLRSMERKYSAALDIFKQGIEDYGHDDIEQELRYRERLVQTFLSLGRLSDAENELRTIHAILADQQPKRSLHHWSMYHRHKSTLAALRLMLFHHREKGRRNHPSKKELLDTALIAADESRKCSGDFYSQSKHPLVDETGKGIALLKKAQARFIYHQYGGAHRDALRGAGILAGYSNSRWWRMSCLDLAARSLAMLGRCNEARKELRKAQNVFDDSGKDDCIRECELLRSEGLILLKQGRVEESIARHQDSLKFTKRKNVSSPCIELAHLSDLATAQLIAGDLSKAKATLEKAERVKISW